MPQKQQRPGEAVPGAASENRSVPSVAPDASDGKPNDDRTRGELLVLGCVLASLNRGEGIPADAADLSFDGFRDPALRAVWKALQDQYSAGAEFDILDIEDGAKNGNNPWPVEETPWDVCNRAMKEADTLFQVNAFPGALREMVDADHARRVRLHAEAVARYAKSGDIDGADRYLAKLNDLANQHRRRGGGSAEAYRVDRLWAGFAETLQARAAGELPMVPTQIRGLDDLFGGGLPASQVVLFCGSPGAGKTSVALDWAVQHAQRGGRAVFWSLELPPHLLLSRIVCQKTQAPWAKVLAGGCPEDTAATASVVEGLDLYVVDTPGDAGESAVRALLPPLGPGELPHLLVIDYTQQLARGGVDQRVAVEEASARVLNLAMSTGAAVLAISSTSRATYNLGADGDPDILRVLAMARDTGRLEFDAAGVLGLIKVKDLDAEEDPGAERYSKAWCCLAKNRLGMTGRVAVELDGQAGTAREIDPAELTTTRKSDEALAKDILDAVSLAQVKGQPLTSKNEICDRVKGRRARKLDVLTDLLRDGRLEGGNRKPFRVPEAAP